MKQLEAEVFGPTRDPDRKSLRTRMHTLESAAAAERVAEQVLENAKAQREAGRAEHFGRRAVYAGLAMTAVVTGINVLVSLLLR